MPSPAQVKATRTPLAWVQRILARTTGVPVSAIQRMQASEPNRGASVDPLGKVFEAFDHNGIEMIAPEKGQRAGGHEVRVK